MSSDTKQPQINKKALTAVYKDTGKCKKKKVKEIQGRKIYDTYFSDKLIQTHDNKNPLQKLSDSLLSLLPMEAQRNIKHTCGSIKNAVANLISEINGGRSGDNKKKS